MKNKDNKLSRNAVLYLAAIVFYYVSSGAFGMLQGIYIKELQIGEDFLGLIISMKALSVAAFSIPCAMFVNKYGRKKGIFLSMILAPIFIIFQGYFDNKWIILIIAALQGGASAFLMVSEGPFFMENSNEKSRLKLFSFSFADNVFSTMIGYYIFGNLSGNLEKTINVVKALKYSIMLSGAVGLFSIVFVMMIKENNITTANNGKTVFFKDMLNILRNKQSFQFIFYTFIIGFGAGLVTPYFNVYLKYKINIGTGEIGLILSLAQGAMGIGCLVTPYIAKRLGKVNTVIICQAISIPFLMLIALPPSVIVVSIALFMRNAFMNMAMPIINNMAMDIVGEEQRSIFASINGISGNLSRGLSAVAAGFIMRNFTNGYEIPYFLTAVLYITATIYFYNHFKSYEKIKISLVKA